jgi:hypothetical protein
MTAGGQQLTTRAQCFSFTQSTDLILVGQQFPEKQPALNPFSRAISISKGGDRFESSMPGTQYTCERHFPNPALLAGRVSGHEMFR